MVDKQIVKLSAQILDNLSTMTPLAKQIVLSDLKQAAKHSTQTQWDTDQVSQCKENIN